MIRTFEHNIFNAKHMSELIYYDLKQSVTMTPSMSVQVAREIGRRIIAGTYEPGSLIEDENALAERYQVSRVVIRDAVKILVGKGLLEVRRGIGTKVRNREQWVLWDDDVLAWHLSAPPSPRFLSQLMEIRLAFEPKAARWAAERATEEDILAIEAAYVAMETEKGSVENFVIADAKFHQTILRSAHNEFLKAIEGMVCSALLVSIRMTNKDPRENEESIPYHRDVYRAIASGNGKRAEKCSEKMLADTVRRIQEETA